MIWNLSAAEDDERGLTGIERKRTARAASSSETEPMTSEATQLSPVQVGKGATVRGHILGCDTLRVEGCVEGTAVLKRLVVVKGGRFEGTLDCREAVIDGECEGTISVAGRLVVRQTGRVLGNVRYRELVIESGGVLSGEISTHLDPIRNETPKAVAAAMTHTIPLTLELEIPQVRETAIDLPFDPAEAANGHLQ